MEHLPVLIVVLPMISAAACVLITHPVIARWFAAAVAWATLGMAITLLEDVRVGGTLSYALGGWEPPVGIEYRIDIFNASVLVLVSAIASVVLPFGPTRALHEAPDERKNLFYAAFLLAFCGLLGITATGDAFNVFVFLEVSSLATYILVAMGRDRRALTAAFTYLVIGTIGGTFYLIGVGLLYAMTGTLNMADMAVRLHSNVGGVVPSDTGTVAAGLGFVIVGMSLKLAVFPLHQWLPNAYAYAPEKVTAFIAATSTKVALYAMLRVIFGVLGAAWVFGELHVDQLFTPLAVAGMFVGSFVAIYERNLKRMLAWSSIAQVGYMVLGVSMVSVNGLTAGIVHLFNHAFIKAGLFLALGCVMYRVGSVHLDDLKGVGRQMPLTFMAFVVGGLGLIGVPLTVGFISKWYLVLATVEKGEWLLTGLVLASSLLAVIYIFKVIEVMWLQAPEPGRQVREAPLSMLLPCWILIAATIVFGVWTPYTAGLARSAATMLLGAG